MIGAARRVLAAANAVLLAYAIRTVFALALVGRFGLELATLFDAQPQGDDGIVALLTLVIRTLPAQAQAMLALGGFYLVLAPLLTQLVLESLAHPRSLSSSLRAAWPRYPHALVLSAARWALLALCLVIAASGSEWLAACVPSVLEEGARLLVLCVSALSVLWIATAHDLCASALSLARTSLSETLRRGARTARARPLLAHAALGLISSLFFALGDLGARPVSTPFIAIAIQQTAGIFSALTHALWLLFAQSQLAASDRPLHTGQNEPANNDRSL